VDLFYQIEGKLKESRPGWSAQKLMLTNPRPGNQSLSLVEKNCIKAAVLILLYTSSPHYYTILTRRTDQVNTHKGQISFPGGRKEPSEQIEQTAIREMAEELGIPSSSYRILGELTPLYVPPTNFCIYPLVAGMEGRPAINPSSDEIDEVLEIPLCNLLNPQNKKMEVRHHRGQKIEVPFYAFAHHKIWGASAMILAELLALIPDFQKNS
jgi:8-oxo-dGTP pyrophosphatase MutT (NUDIX family)